jgi:hypothetical protein
MLGKHYTGNLKITFGNSMQGWEDNYTMDLNEAGDYIRTVLHITLRETCNSLDWPSVISLSITIFGPRRQIFKGS